MKTIRLFFVIVLFLIASISSLFAQSTAANAGKEFYISYLRNMYQITTLELKVVVENECYITAKYNQSGFFWNGWDNSLVQPGIYTANVSYNDVVNVPPFGSGGVTSRTLTLTATEDICVYAINYSNNSSADATCVLPVSIWGTEYRLASGHPALPGAYAVVASENNTEVTLHDNSTITLQKNQVYHFLHNTAFFDMTGMKITATQPVALFSGAITASSNYFCLPGVPGSQEHTYEQLWSVDKWGKDFFAFSVSTPGSNINWGGTLALVAHENDTHITLSGGINDGTPLDYTLNAGEKEYVCYLMSGLIRIVSDKPIMVFLVLPNTSVMYIPPTDQRIHHALMAPFILTSNSNINQHGIDMLVPAAYWNQTVIKHNGVVVSNSLYNTVDTSADFPDWYHIRKDLLENVDIKIDVTCPGGFLAYISGSGFDNAYAFCAGAGAYDLQNYFTIQEKGTTIDTYYENTTEETHTFETTDIIVVKRTVETPFDSVSWLINGVPYSISENSNITDTLNFPATALHSGENSITMSVRFTETEADSLYTGKVWLNSVVEFYANDVYYEDLPDTVFCAKNVDFRAEIEGELHPDEGRIQWFVDGIPETAAEDKLKWSRIFDTTKDYEIEMLVRFENNQTTTITSTLKMKILWVKMRNIKKG